MPLSNDSFLEVAWPAPERVKTCVTTRLGGVSKAPYQSLNLALHVADDTAAVEQNRLSLQRHFGWRKQPQWLQQVHGTRVVGLPFAAEANPQADACFSRELGELCAIMTADCLPLLFCNRKGTQIAAAHAGWRGLAAGVIEQTVGNFPDAKDLLVWLGPAISQRHFVVGSDVLDAFTQLNNAMEAYFLPLADTPPKWLADLYGLAKFKLNLLGVDAVFGGNFCTYAEAETFYSFRRDGETGRMASIIWLED